MMTMPVRRIPFLFLLGLAACASPSPDMLGGTRQAMRADGMDFIVIRKAGEVQVIRLGYLPRDRRDRVPAIMAVAAARATGCTVIPHSITASVPGDPGVERFDLDCA